MAKAEGKEARLPSFGILGILGLPLQMWQAQAVTAEFAGSFALVFLAMEPLRSTDSAALVANGAKACNIL